jgi:hypothetical protein
MEKNILRMLTVLQYGYMEAFGGYDTSLIVANVNAVAV